MRSRKVPRTKYEGRSPESSVQSPTSIVFLSALAALVLFAGCDWLLRVDTTPPTCQITSPVDSSSVNGAVPIMATAYDSVGVEWVEFYVDGSLVGTDSFAPYSVSWNASGQTEGSWHSLSCIAYDAAQNKGYSDTIAVQITRIGQTSVFHGELEVQANDREAVSFDANAGDTLSGEVLVVAGGTLSRILWLDRDNYEKYLANQPYTTLFQQGDVSQMSMRQGVVSSGEFYLVFANASSLVVDCWARFVLE